MCWQKQKIKNVSHYKEVLTVAIGRINVRTGQKGKGKAHFNYLMREGKYDQRQGDFVEMFNINIPEWADSPEHFWESADELERKNGSTYREHILTLPREFTHEQNKKLLNDWMEREYKNKHAITVVFHTPTASDGDKQPHAHMMICERELDNIERNREQFFKRYNSKNPSKGGAKKINTGMDKKERKYALLEQRQRWGDLLNEHLLKNGFNADIDMRGWYFRGETEKPKNILMGDFKRNGVRPPKPDQQAPEAALQLTRAEQEQQYFKTLTRSLQQQREQEQEQEQPQAEQVAQVKRPKPR